MNLEAALQLIRSRGASSTSFQTLYSGYRYFESDFSDEKAVLAYWPTRTAWIGASDPIVSERNLVEFLTRFKDAAQKTGRAAAILPMSKSFASLARSAGHSVIQIGNEPWYQLKSMLGREVPLARQLYRKGGRVEKFDLATIATRERSELNDITRRWLGSRKMANLSFLNRVEPWTHFHDKRYFRATFHGHQIGYLAAVPIPARNAWYLVDLIRDPDSPTGTTELLVTEAVRTLSEEGAAEITLGMSPFAQIEATETPHHPLTYWAFNHIFHRLELFYGFKSLFSYKQKYNPDRWEPQYFVSLSKRPKLRVYLGLFEAIFPKGIFHTAYSTLGRLTQQFTLARLYRATLNSNLVPRSPPENVFDFFKRCKVTAGLMVTCILYFFTTTNANFHLRDGMAKRYPFSLENIFQGTSPTRGVIDLIIASFLHWDWTHLLINLSMMAILMSFLECTIGSLFTLGVFSAGILLSNPLTALVIGPLLYLFSPTLLYPFLNEPDVGSSLGVFACIGALAYFSKRPVLILSLFSLATLIYNLNVSSILGYNHIFALMIGYFIGRKYVHLHD